MTLHFEDLWVKCEQSHQIIKDETVQDIINKLILQINLYKALDLKNQIPAEEMQKIKSHTFGEILLTLTNLSLKDNIDVFSALISAYQFNQSSD